MSRALSAALVRAEAALRARGLTGGQAFDELVHGLKARLGLEPEVAGPGAEVALELPLERGHDLLGLAYERFFPDLFKGQHGQYFTPPPIARLMFSALPIRPGDRVVDPACGSGTLLAEAAARGATVRGIDVDPRLVELARLGLELRGADARIERGDLFLTPADPCDVLVANPPFSIRLTDPAVLSRFAMGRGRDSVLSDQLFVEAMEGWVRPAGHAGVVLPWSVLTNPSFAAVRERIDRHWRRRAVLALPEGVFRPFGGAAGRAAILVLQRLPAEPGPVSWAEVEDPGYDVRRKTVRLTSSAQVDALACGDGWTTLPSSAWTPTARSEARPDVRSVGDLAREREACTIDEPAWVVDLADAVRRTGEVLPRRIDGRPGSRRRRLNEGDVLVARMRPNLGNVVWLASLPPNSGGSPEWIALTAPSAPGYLWHALRTPTWRSALPLTAGQTRPRTDPATVLASEVRWPGDDVAGRIHELSARFERARTAAREGLEEVQDAVDAYAAGQIDAEDLARRIGRIEASAGDTTPHRDRSTERRE